MILLSGSCSDKQIPVNTDLYPVPLDLRPDEVRSLLPPIKKWLHKGDVTRHATTNFVLVQYNRFVSLFLIVNDNCAFCRCVTY